MSFFYFNLVIILGKFIFNKLKNKKIKNKANVVYIIFFL
jgi:hypothetical protein